MAASTSAASDEYGFVQCQVVDAVATARAAKAVLCVFVAGDDTESDAQALESFRTEPLVTVIRNSVAIRTAADSEDARNLCSFLNIAKTPRFVMLSGETGELLLKLDGDLDAGRIEEAFKSHEAKKFAALLALAAAQQQQQPQTQTQQAPSQPTQAKPQPSRPRGVLHPKSAGEFYKIVSAKCSSVVDFTASWCGPCKRITPLFEKLCSEYPDLQFVKVDVDELDTVANDEGIRAMPTFLVFRTSAIVDKVQGANPAHLQAMVSRAAAHDEDAKRAAEAKSSGKGASTPGGQAAAPTPAMQSKAKGASSKGKGVLGQKPASASASASKAGTSSAPPRPKKAKTKAAPRAEPRVSAPLQYTSCNIHVRLSDGKTLAMAFPATTLFKEVLDAVDNERTDGKGPFHLKVPFSSEVLDATKGEKTLAALDVGPRAMLVLVPEAAVTKAPGGGGASVGAGASPIGGLLSWLVAFFMDLIGRVFPRGVGGDGAANQEGRAEDGGNVKRGNEYWNGNSTEFLSPDDAAKADKSKDD